MGGPTISGTDHSAAIRTRGRSDAPRRSSNPSMIHAVTTNARPDDNATIPSTVPAVPDGNQLSTSRSSHELVGPYGPTNAAAAAMADMPTNPMSVSAAVEFFGQDQV